MYAVKNKTKAKQQQQIVTFPEWVCLTRCSRFMQMDAVFVIQLCITGQSKREIWFVQTAKLFFYHSRTEVHILWFFNWLQRWKVRHIMQVLAVKQAGMHSSSVCTAKYGQRFTSAGLTGRAGLLWVFHLFSFRGEKLNKLAFISLCRWSLW